MLRLDHLVVSATTLDEGTAHVEGVLGVTMAPRGEHALMSTHNRLLGLGDVYLEVIAANPGAPPPGRPRWFDLDRFTGPPRLTNWVAACDDLAAALARSPRGTGVITSLSRGDLRWEMAVPEDGRLPFDGTFPGLIHWHGPAHPARRLPDSGLRLERFEITHPEGAALVAALAGRLHDDRIVITTSPRKAMHALLSGPNGTVEL